MLNPSTADGLFDDATIRTCVRFATGWGYAGIEVGNIFALRSRNPKELARSEDIVGPQNDTWLQMLVQGPGHGLGILVAAWGANAEKKHLVKRTAEVKMLLTKSCDVYCLGLTTGGSPRHPLYLPNGTQPQLWLPKTT